jgi:hypothetical protein
MSNTTVYSSNFGRLRGKRAWRQNLHLAAMSAAKVESALGPRGAYKMVTFNRGPERIIKVTKDSVEMLKELEVQYPAVKTLAEAAKLHREEVGRRRLDDGHYHRRALAGVGDADGQEDPSQRHAPGLPRGHEGGPRSHPEDRDREGRVQEPDTRRRRVRQEAADPPPEGRAP